mgnify:FL=1
MLEAWLVVTIALAYIGVLFGVAYFGDQAARQRGPRPRPLVYSLTLALFCTSWSFFGTVGQAARFGWVSAPPLGSVLLLVPTYVLPIVMYLVLWRFFEKLARVGAREKITSIADFISARYGKSQSLAALVTLIAVVGVIPYVALQLKSVSLTYELLSGSAAHGAGLSFWQDTALYVAMLMALFAMLFGTRTIDATEHNHGMMLAVAFESVVKLLAFLAIGLFVSFGMFDGFGDLASRIQARGVVEAEAGAGSAFFTQILLGGLVIICLPRLFHAAVVENTDPSEIRTARWLYPLYLLVLGAFVWPIAAAGLVYFAPGSVDADTFVLALPMAEGRPWLATIAFIGGFSASTSMVIVSSLALSIMVCNDAVMPLLLRWRRLGLNRRKDLGPLVLWVRRCAIALLLLLAYGYYRLTAEYVALASFGVLSFVAVAQFAPALIGGLYWKRGSRLGAFTGMAVGFAFWIYCLLVPMLAQAGLLPSSLLEQGLFGVDWLRPTALFGVEELDAASHGALWSLSTNLLCYVTLSLLGRQRLIERTQATAFVERSASLQLAPGGRRRTFLVEDLQLVAERFLGATRAQTVLAAYSRRHGRRLLPEQRAEPELVEEIERMLAAVLGASSARVVMESALDGRRMQLEEVATIVGETSQVLQFNRELLQVTFESLSQGIMVVDRELRLVAWNRRYAELFDYDEGFLRVGKRIAAIVRYNVERGEYGPVADERDITLKVATALAPLRQHRAYSKERVRPDGTVLEVRGNPMPGGGFVTTYMDITAHKRTEEALRESEQNIRVYTDNVPALIAYVDKSRRFRFANRGYETLFGVDRDSICGKLPEEVLPPDAALQREPYVEAVLAGEPQQFQVDLRTAEGRIRHAFATYIPDRNESGEVVGFYALTHDITERVEAERALREAKADLERRVEERTRALRSANDALQAAKLEAERANLSKTRFLAAASHDLLQPLNAAGLFSEALAQRLNDRDDKQLVGDITNALRSAESLLSELLDISKLDAGALRPEIEDFPLDDLLRELQREYTVLAQRKGLVLRLRSSGLYARSDRKLLRRVVQNFLSNAIRYTERGGVLLGVRRRGEFLRIEVWDSGPGIPSDQRQKIFEEFHRLDHHDRSGEKCQGLGLAIAERIGRMLGHDINVRSWPGRGSVFSISLPLGERAACATPEPIAPPPGSLAGLHVLCVDNEPAILQGMERLLSGWGCRVAIALNGEEALAELNAGGVPDVMLVDYHLDAAENGLDVMAAVRAQAGLDVPGVVISADQSGDVKEQVLAAGYRFLGKPVKPATLRALLSRLAPIRATGTSG